MVDWSIEAMREAHSVRSIVVACPPGHIHDLGGHDLGVVDGGETRAVSVANALEAVGTALVAIHDAARPLLSARLVEDVVATLLDDDEADGAIAAAPVSDTIKRVSHARGGAGQEAKAAFDPSGGQDAALAVDGTIDRTGLWAAQTPQVFRVEALRRALEADPVAVAAATDEAMLVEAAGGRVLIHPSPAENIKVTTPLDLRVAELLLAQRSAEQHPDQGGCEAELADAEGDAEVDRAEDRRDRRRRAANAAARTASWTGRRALHVSTPGGDRGGAGAGSGWLRRSPASARAPADDGCAGARRASAGARASTTPASTIAVRLIESWSIAPRQSDQLPSAAEMPMFAAAGIVVTETRTPISAPDLVEVRESIPAAPAKRATMTENSSGLTMNLAKSFSLL